MIHLKKDEKRSRKKTNCFKNLKFFDKNDRNELMQMKIQEMKRKRNENEKKDEKRQKS